MRKLKAFLGFGLVAGGVTILAAADRPVQDLSGWIEGTFEYVPPLRGQSFVGEGRFVFLYGPADGSGPMVGEAGTYEVISDTVVSTVTYATDPERVGHVFKWMPVAVSGDTVDYVVWDQAGESPGTGRSIRR
jgi:hypothetical protein